jgi:hypothetical protein
MLRMLAILTLVLTTADHWTTYECLKAPVPGWEVTEANPMAGWLFDWTGLITGLAIDSGITLLAVVFLVSTRAIADPAKLSFLTFISACTGYAVVNNMQAIQDMGLDTLGIG